MNDWLKRRVQLGHNRTLLYDLEEEDIASFKNYLRMDTDTFNEIQERITPRIKKLTTNYKNPIPVRLRLAATLRFLATGNSSKCISYSFRVSHNIACEFFIEVCQAIIDEYADEVTPTTPDGWKEVADEFWKRWKFPHCIGIIDGL